VPQSNNSFCLHRSRSRYPLCRDNNTAAAKQQPNQGLTLNSLLFVLQRRYILLQPRAEVMPAKQNAQAAVMSLVFPTQ
jgi:hypothetical protein